MANYVALTDLEGGAVSINPEEVFGIQVIANALLPSGIAAGSYVYTEDGQRVNVQGTVAAVVAALGVASGAFGQNAQFVDTAATLATAAGPTVAQTLTTPALLAGTYRISWYGECSVDVATDSTAVEAILSTGPTTLAAVAFDFDVNATFSEQFAGYTDIVLAAGAITLTIQITNVGGAGNSNIRRRRLEIFRAA